MYGAPSGSNKKYISKHHKCRVVKRLQSFWNYSNRPTHRKDRTIQMLQGTNHKAVCVCVLIHSCFSLSSLIPDFHYCGGHFPVLWVSLGVVIGFLSVISVLFDAWRINVKLLVLIGQLEITSAWGGDSSSLCGAIGAATACDRRRIADIFGIILDCNSVHPNILGVCLTVWYVLLSNSHWIRRR